MTSGRTGADPDPDLRRRPGVQGSGDRHPGGHQPRVRARPAASSSAEPGRFWSSPTRSRRAHRQPLRRHACRPGARPAWAPASRPWPTRYAQRRAARTARLHGPVGAAGRPLPRRDRGRHRRPSLIRRGRNDHVRAERRPGPGRRAPRSGRRLAQSRSRVRLLLRDGLRAGAGPERRGHIHRHRHQGPGRRRHPDLHVRRRPGVPRPGADDPDRQDSTPRARPAGSTWRGRAPTWCWATSRRRALGQLVRRHPGGSPHRPSSAPATHRRPVRRRQGSPGPRPAAA